MSGARHLNNGDWVPGPGPRRISTTSARERALPVRRSQIDRHDVGQIFGRRSTWVRRRHGTRTLFRGADLYISRLRDVSTSSRKSIKTPDSLLIGVGFFLDPFVDTIPPCLVHGADQLNVT